MALESYAIYDTEGQFYVELYDNGSPNYYGVKEAKYIRNVNLYQWETTARMVIHDFLENSDKYEVHLVELRPLCKGR